MKRDPLRAGDNLEARPKGCMRARQPVFTGLAQPNSLQYGEFVHTAAR